MEKVDEMYFVSVLCKDTKEDSNAGLIRILVEALSIE